MSSLYTLDELIDRWNRGQFAETQVISHILLLLAQQEQWLEVLKRHEQQEGEA